MSLTSLLDSLAASGQRLAVHEGERRERADQLLLPIWNWLQEVSGLTEKVDVPWSTVDDSLAAEDEQAIAMAVKDLVDSLDRNDQQDFESALAKVRINFAMGIQNAQEDLRVKGLEAQSIATLFLPIRSELASWLHREESDQVLTRARSALTEVSATRLALSFNQQFEEDLRQANRFRQGAMVFFMLAVAWSIIAAITLPATITAQGAVGRFVIAASLVVVGGFFTRESNRHRSDANVWRTVQLQLNAIESYCAGMPRDRAEVLRFLLGASVFSGPRLYAVAAGNSNGNRSPESGHASEVAADASLEGSLREILGIVREVAKASRATPQP
ncbi:MAG: hypothetical protein M3335_04320 [Actinomycetota bacterium]|nr:hypothetical protein [Actinomycetota bacterium]